MNKKKLSNILKKHIPNHTIKIVKTKKFPPIAEVIIPGGETRRIRYIERLVDYDDIMIEVATGPRYAAEFKRARAEKKDIEYIMHKISGDPSWIWDSDCDWIVFGFPTRPSIIILYKDKLRKYIEDHIDSLPIRLAKDKKRDKWCVIINIDELKKLKLVI